jgi:FKBP-type peptidyl-prolyl cis-trans isomerase
MVMTIRSLAMYGALLTVEIAAWTPMSAPFVAAATTKTRKAFLQTTVATFSSAILIAATPPASLAAGGKSVSVVSLPNGVSYAVQKSGSTGLKPEIGDLVAIRFAAFAGDNKIDDLFETPEPYYTRLGSGSLLKGVEETLPLMQIGDRWVLTIPVCTAVYPVCARMFCLLENAGCRI